MKKVQARHLTSEDNISNTQRDEDQKQKNNTLNRSEMRRMRQRDKAGFSKWMASAMTQKKANRWMIAEIVTCLVCV
jgi:hypothetical protein